MYERELEAMRKVKAYLENALTKVNRQIYELERKSNENVASKTIVPPGAAMPLHPPVEHPNKGKPTTKRSSSSRRRT